METSVCWKMNAGSWLDAGMHHGEEFFAGHGVVPEAAEHAAGDQVGSVLVDAAAHHAVVLGLDHHCYALRLEDLVDEVSDLRGHPFLDLQPSGVHFHDAGELGDADHPAIRHIGNPGAADDGSDVMLAMTFERDAPEDDHLVVTVHLLESFL